MTNFVLDDATYSEQFRNLKRHAARHSIRRIRQTKLAHQLKIGDVTRERQPIAGICAAPAQ